MSASVIKCRGAPTGHQGKSLQLKMNATVAHINTTPASLAEGCFSVASRSGRHIFQSSPNLAHPLLEFFSTGPLSWLCLQRTWGAFMERDVMLLSQSNCTFK